MHDVVELRGCVGPIGAHRRCRCREARHRGRDLGVATERRMATQHLEHEEAEPVHVGARIRLATVDLLGRQVARGAHDRAGPCEVVGADRLGDAEVGDLHRAAIGHEDVRRFHVAVHEPGTVRGVERVGDLLADADHVTDWQPAHVVDDAAQRGSVHELHHDVRSAVVVAGVVRGDDVRVHDPGRGDRLVAEPGAQCVVLGEVGAAGSSPRPDATAPSRRQPRPSPCHRGREAPRAGNGR